MQSHTPVSMPFGRRIAHACPCGVTDGRFGPATGTRSSTKRGIFGAICTASRRPRCIGTRARGSWTRRQRSFDQEVTGREKTTYPIVFRSKPAARSSRTTGMPRSLTLRRWLVGAVLADVGRIVRRDSSRRKALCAKGQGRGSPSSRSQVSNLAPLCRTSRGNSSVWLRRSKPKPELFSSAKEKDMTWCLERDIARRWSRRDSKRAFEPKGQDRGRQSRWEAHSNFFGFLVEGIVTDREIGRYVIAAKQALSSSC